MSVSLPEHCFVPLWCSYMDLAAWDHKSPDLAPQCKLNFSFFFFLTNQFTPGLLINIRTSSSWSILVSLSLQLSMVLQLNQIGCIQNSYTLYFGYQMQLIFWHPLSWVDAWYWMFQFIFKWDQFCVQYATTLCCSTGCTCLRISRSHNKRKKNSGQTDFTWIENNWFLNRFHGNICAKSILTLAQSCLDIH